MTDYTKTTKQQLSPGITLNHTIQGHRYRTYSVAWSPDGNYLASGSPDHTLSPIGKFLAPGSRDDNIGLWIVQTEEAQRVFKGNTGGVAAPVH